MLRATTIACLRGLRMANGSCSARTCIRPEGGGEALFSVDVATGTERIIGNVGPGVRPRSNLNPAVRLSLAPDGKSLVFGTITPRSSLWMLEGFAVKTGRSEERRVGKERRARW